MHPVLSISTEEKAMPYMRGIRMRRGTSERLIDNEIMPIFLDSHLVSDPLERRKDPPISRPESHIVPRENVPIE